MVSADGAKSVVAFLDFGLENDKDDKQVELKWKEVFGSRQYLECRNRDSLCFGWSSL